VGCELRSLAAPRDGQWKNRSAHERGDRPLGSHDQLARRAQERVEHRGEKKRIEAVDGRHSGHLGVRHRRGQCERGDRQTREQVAAPGVRTVGG
jgi:hypothetical protein